MGAGCSCCKKSNVVEPFGRATLPVIPSSQPPVLAKVAWSSGNGFSAGTAPGLDALGCDGGRPLQKSLPPRLSSGHTDGGIRSPDPDGRASSDNQVSDEHWDQEMTQLPPFFSDIITELDRHKEELGGSTYFKACKPFVERKVKRRDLANSYSDYEYIYLTVLGFANMHRHRDELLRRNNGRNFARNPGVQMLERVSGFTMHAERQGANHVLMTAPACLVEAFQLNKHWNLDSMTFFKGAFDRLADPCLEGRVGRLMAFTECLVAKFDSSYNSLGPPWDDVSLRPLPAESSPLERTGEHLRVFIAECTWRWSQNRNFTYEEAKMLRFNDEHAKEFTMLYNAAEFEATMLARGVATDATIMQWETCEKTSPTSGEKWVPHDPDVSLHFERARRQGMTEIETRIGSQAWKYTVDFKAMVQRDMELGQERPLRRVEVAAASCHGRMTLDELRVTIDHFVEMETLPPPPGLGNTGASLRSVADAQDTMLVDRGALCLDNASCISSVSSSSLSFFSSSQGDTTFEVQILKHVTSTQNVLE
eukprot:TRINITY_DN67107_c0_g1_i1.p1 TRINITY_DN67107_c0_g1~~TRINITY_DN67107_c0_g1_i1.p1  ORF type:complete len:535 (-),score=75.07 TRINITY_DN67107_c0_g1_i1:320-1924(-)